MIEKIFGVAEQPATTTLSTAVSYVVAALLIGLIISGVYVFITEKRRRSPSFVLTMILLPAVVTIIIVLVGTNVARAFSVAGVFSLVRFRSEPGEGKDITFVFLAMAGGLACGLGYLSMAFILVIGLGVVVVIAGKIIAALFTDVSKQLRILIPENMDYNGVFDDLFSTYTNKAELVKVKTTNMGTLFELTYRVEMKAGANEKKFMDDIRCRNGNLAISLAQKEKETERL